MRITSRVVSFLKKANLGRHQQSPGLLSASHSQRSGICRGIVGLAKTYLILGTHELLPPNESFPKAAADNALQLDEALSEAYTARALA
jgi:hypothetical protein